MRCDTPSRVCGINGPILADRNDRQFEVAEEGQIEVDLTISGAIKGTHRGLADTARRLRRIGEEDQHRGHVRRAPPGEDLAPRFFRVREDHRHELRLRIVVSYTRGADRAVLAAIGRVQEVNRVGSGQSGNQEQEYESTNPSTNWKAHAHPATVLDISAAWSSLPPHARSSGRT